MWGFEARLFLGGRWDQGRRLLCPGFFIRIPLAARWGQGVARRSGKWLLHQSKQAVMAAGAWVGAVELMQSSQTLDLF